MSHEKLANAGGANVRSGDKYEALHFCNAFLSNQGEMGLI